MNQSLARRWGVNGDFLLNSAIIIAAAVLFAIILNYAGTRKGEPPEASSYVLKEASEVGSTIPAFYKKTAFKPPGVLGEASAVSTSSSSAVQSQSSSQVTSFPRKTGASTQKRFLPSSTSTAEDQVSAVITELSVGVNRLLRL